MDPGYDGYGQYGRQNSHGQYGDPGGTPNQGQYGQNQGQYGQNQGQYGQSQGQYGQSQGQYSQYGDYAGYPPQQSPYAGYGYGPPPSARPQQQQQQQRAPPASPYGQPFPGADVLQNPMMQDMAMQYGQNVLGQGRQAVEQSMEKYMSISRLKYYFAVDTAYVSRKLRLLFLPFTNSDWSVRYSSEEPIQPRHEVNAPDLYIPSMAFITYILVAGFLLGKQQRFSPEALGMQASSATAWLVFEVVVVLLTMYVMNTQTNLRTFDIIAFSGYKFVGMIVTLLSSLFLDRTGYYCVLLYCSAMCALFLVRTLKVQLQPVQEDLQGGSGVKRRLYLLLLISAVQPIMMYWLTTHLVFFAPPLPAFDPLPPSTL